MTLQELLVGLNSRLDFTEAELSDLLESPDLAARTTARAALAKTAIRNALQAAADLARAQGFSDQGTLNVIQRLAEISDWDEPFIDVLKGLGIQAAGAGDVNTAMQYLQEAVNRGFASGQRRDSRSRRAMRFAHDIEIDRAIERLAGFVPGPRMLESPSEPVRIICLCSILADEDGPSVMTLKRAQYFHELGFAVEVVSTGMGASSGSQIVRKLRELGLGFTETPRGTWEQRIRWLVTYFEALQPDVAVYLTSAVDNLAKLAACIGLAPVQTFDVRALEPQVGKFDLINHGVSPEQEIKTAWPGLSRFTGGGVAMADEIDQATPLQRNEIGAPDGAVLLATFGRIEKCDTPVYLDSLARILEAEPTAWLVLAGPDSSGRLPSILEYFTRHGVAGRVAYLGMRQSDAPRLVKTVDVYCDTHPWTGGQSLMDAMQAGLPIVGMRRALDADLDPTSAGAITATAETRLEGLVPIADAGDVEAYVEIARGYVQEPEKRKRDGQLLRNRALEQYSLRKSTMRYAEIIRQVLGRRAAQ